MNEKYRDMLDMDRPLSRKHHPMSMEARAAQFAPFAALTGLDSMMEDTAEKNEIAQENELQRDSYDESC